MQKTKAEKTYDETVDKYTALKFPIKAKAEVGDRITWMTMADHDALEVISVTAKKCVAKNLTGYNGAAGSCYSLPRHFTSFGHVDGFNQYNLRQKLG